MEVSSRIRLCDKEDGRQEHNIGNVSTKISSIFSETYIYKITIRLSACPSVTTLKQTKGNSWIREEVDRQLQKQFLVKFKCSGIYGK
jgi:hypothetical protein